MTPQALAELLTDAKSLQNDVSNWRQFLHRYPELSGEESGTAAFVAGKLEEIGVNGIQQHFASTYAVIAEITGDLPGPTVALRADMDALPIQELNQTPYCSQRPGIMHACGHDAHTAILLAASSLLMRRRHLLHGKVRLIFQPSEERTDRPGAAHLIAEGILQQPPVDAIFALHAFPELPVGIVATRPGVMMAAADVFEIRLKGKGSHASRPHMGVDTVLMAAQVINTLHHIVSRKVDPLHPAVLTIGRITGGKADNVIPEQVILGGTVRTLNLNLRSEFPKWIEHSLQGIASAYGGSFTLDYHLGTSPVLNHLQTTEYALHTLRSLLGESQVQILADPSMGGEDFGEYLQQIPGTFLRLGVNNPQKNILAPLHSAYFDLDESALPIGAAALAALALNWKPALRSAEAKDNRQD